MNALDLFADNLDRTAKALLAMAPDNIAMKTRCITLQVVAEAARKASIAAAGGVENGGPPTATVLLLECEKALSACAEYGKPCSCGNCELAGKVRTYLKGVT